MHIFIVLLLGVVVATHGWNAHGNGQQSPEEKREASFHYSNKKRSVVSASPKLTDSQHEKRNVAYDDNTSVIAEQHAKRSVMNHVNQPAKRSASHGHHAIAEKHVEKVKRSAADFLNFGPIIVRQKRLAMNDNYLNLPKNAKRSAADLDNTASVVKNEKRSPMTLNPAKNEKRSAYQNYVDKIYQEKRSVMSNLHNHASNHFNVYNTAATNLQKRHALPSHVMHPDVLKRSISGESSGNGKQRERRNSPYPPPCRGPDCD